MTSLCHGTLASASASALALESVALLTSLPERTWLKTNNIRDNEVKKKRDTIGHGQITMEMTK